MKLWFALSLSTVLLGDPLKGSGRADEADGPEAMYETYAALHHEMFTGNARVVDVISDCREDLRQIAQRITARFHLDPLSREETSGYVRHRLRVAGATTDIFTRGALREIYRISLEDGSVLDVATGKKVEK